MDKISQIMNSMPFLQKIDRETLVIAILGGSLILLFILMDLFTSIFKVKRRAKKKINTDAPILEELQDQLSIISNHASIYANSLGSDGAKLLNELKSIVDSQTETLELLQLCLDTGQIEELKDFYKKFDEQTPKQKLFWISRSHHLVELLGRKLYEISERSTSVGLPKYKRREGTIESLRRWNIIK